MEPNLKVLHVNLEIVDGESIAVKSQYYRQLNKYSRSMIRALNKPCTDTDRSYYLAQLALIKKEMQYYQEKFFAMYTQAYNATDAKAIISKSISDY